LESIVFADEETLSQFAAAPDAREHKFDWLRRAIDQLPEGPIKNAILDWKAGTSVEDSALRRGVSPRTIDRLRERARQLVRELRAAELAQTE
jgi:DNA-directed RNA polymerase specialized sigma24 family protein